MESVCEITSLVTMEVFDRQLPSTTSNVSYSQSRLSLGFTVTVHIQIFDGQVNAVQETSALFGCAKHLSSRPTLVARLMTVLLEQSFD